MTEQTTETNKPLTAVQKRLAAVAEKRRLARQKAAELEKAKTESEIAGQDPIAAIGQRHSSVPPAPSEVVEEPVAEMHEASEPEVDEGFEQLITAIEAGNVAEVASEMSRYFNEGSKEQKDRISAALEKAQSAALSEATEDAEIPASSPLEGEPNNEIGDSFGAGDEAEVDAQVESAFGPFEASAAPSAEPEVTAEPEEVVEEPSGAEEAEQESAEPEAAPAPAPVAVAELDESAVRDMVTRLFEEKSSAVIAENLARNAENAALKERNAELEAEKAGLQERADELDMAIASVVATAQAENIVPDVSELKPMDQLATLLTNMVTSLKVAVSDAKTAATAVLGHEAELSALYNDDLPQFGEPEELALLSEASAVARVIDGLMEISPEEITTAMQSGALVSLLDGADIPTELDARIKALEQIVTMTVEIEKQCGRGDDGSFEVSDKTRRHSDVVRNMLVKEVTRLLEDERSIPEEKAVQGALSVGSRARAVLPILRREKKLAEEAEKKADESSSE